MTVLEALKYTCFLEFSWKIEMCAIFDVMNGMLFITFLKKMCFGPSHCFNNDSLLYWSINPNCKFKLEIGVILGP